MIFDFGAPGVPPKGPRKLKFMEPIRVWYQVNTPGAPYPNNFCAPSRKSAHALERLRWLLA